MGLFEEIRREYRFGVGTIQGVASKLKTHRRMVRPALASAIPPERKKPARSSPKLEPVREFIDGILQSDRGAPRKQRHTAHRIWERIGQEHPTRWWRKRRCCGMYSGARKNWGWRRARRSCRRVTTGASRGRWIGTKPRWSLPRAARRRIFSPCAAWHAVARFTPRIFTPRSRLFWKRTSRRFIILAAWVEGEVGYFRRNHLVPVPKVKDLGGLKSICARAASGMSSGVSTESRTRWAKRWASSGSICCRWPAKALSWRKRASLSSMARAA